MGEKLRPPEENIAPVNEEKKSEKAEKPLTREEWEKAEDIYYKQLYDQAMREKAAKKNHMFAPPPPRMLKEKQELLDKYLNERQELIEEAGAVLAKEKTVKDANDEYIKSQGGERITIGNDGVYKDYIKIDGHTIEAPLPPPRSKKNQELLQKYYNLQETDSKKKETRDFANPDLPKPPPPRRKLKK